MAILSGVEEARIQALELAATLTLPVTARSLTAAEIARIDGRYVPIILCIFFAFALPLLAIFAVASGSGPGSVMIVAGVMALIAALLWLIARRRARARADYLDPAIVIEIGAEGITLRAPGRIETLDYTEAKAGINYVRMRGATHFLGMALESPLGPLRLEDPSFKPGRTAAAALAGRMDAKGVLPREDD